MFNNLKSFEFFDPEKVKVPVHIIGCGAVGGSVGEILTRTGLKEIHIWDMDTVSAHNLGNQVYKTADIGTPKTTALQNILTDINPDIKVNIHGAISTSERISGYIFLCVDNIDLRRELCTKWKNNPNIKFITDGRMRLTDATIHSADWSNFKEQENMLNSMQYTHEEALAETPVSACGLTLSVICTPRMLAALMAANFIKFINTKTYERFTQIDCYQPFLESFTA